MIGNGATLVTSPEPAAPTAHGRVGIVVVSHSEELALAAVALGAQMLQNDELAIEVAAGVDGGFGTDAVAIKAGIERADSGAGVLVLVDMGSAVLSTELAIEMIDDPTMQNRVTVTPAPLVEGLVTATVAAAGGASLADVDAEARNAMAGKLAHLGETGPNARTGAASTGRTDDSETSAVFRVRNEHGLHARPASRLVNEVTSLDADVELTNQTTGTGPVPAGSLSRVATLGAQAGHEIRVRAVGLQAHEAVDRLVALAERRFDEPESAATLADSTDRDTKPAEHSPGRAGPLPGSPGVVVGPARRFVPAQPHRDEVPISTPSEEWERLENAYEAVRREIRESRDLAARTAGEQEAAIFDAHLTLLDDAAITEPVRARVDDGARAADAWSQTMLDLQRTWSELPDAYLRERADDIVALRQQVLDALIGVGEHELSAPGILIAKDLTPAQTARLDVSLVRGVVLSEGSPTSHAAILARARAIPLAVSAGAAVLNVAEGVTVALDGATGEVVLEPDDDTIAVFNAKAAEQRERQRAQASGAHRDAVTADGVRVVVGANLGSLADAEAGKAQGADKAGLVRTEFLFLDRSSPPDEDEQTRQYLDLSTAMGGRDLTVRTLDVGGDKPLSYLPTRTETNPFLGRRGVRLSLHERALLRTQLRAICRAAREARISVMVPMVSTPSELGAVRTLLDEAAGGGDAPADLRFGMMVEVPSTALKIDAFTPYLDFVSIGTNDLTQYAMAAERGNADVEHLSDPLDPGVLRLIAAVAAASSKVAVSVCGEVAADHVAVPLLLGMGIRELSVAPPAVPRVKDQVRRLDADRCASLAERALDLEDAAQVRDLVRKDLAQR